MSYTQLKATKRYAGFSPAKDETRVYRHRREVLYRKAWLATALVGVLSLASASGEAAANGLDDGPFAGDHQWSGAYIGASVGYGWGESAATYDRNGDDHLSRETVNPAGYLGSLTLGYNYQPGGNLLIGVEGDLGLMDVDSGDRTGLWDGHVWKSQYGGMWGTLRARAGLAFGDLLLYGTGGLALMETHETILGDGDATQNTYNEGVHAGWVVGGGGEFAFSDKLSLKLEYLHMDFDKYEGYTNNQELYSFDNKIDVVRVGLNYKF